MVCRVVYKKHEIIIVEREKNVKQMKSFKNCAGKPFSAWKFLYHR